MQRLLLTLTLGIGLTAVSLRADDASVSSPLSPDAERATFHLADGNLLVELVAGDAEVNSPVALCWDAAGRMFVAEMGDYPVGPGKGRIRLLEDRDRDGRYETSRVYADSIAFPTGVLPARGGLLVTAAPDILFLQDADGDGQAERREVLFTGFGEGNQQLRVNGLIWGADNWIYGANGRSDGTIRRPSDPPEKAVSIRGRDFRFRSDGSQFEAVTGGSQFGLARDDWGERFVSWNTIPLRHTLLAQTVLERSPQLAEYACRNIADPADDTRVFPLSAGPQVFNKEPAGFYNALCGLTIFRGEGLGADYAGNALVCESLRNLVHRRKLVAEGPSFVSERAVKDAEFLASSDPWFHPVFLATGPDGALYVADFYRRWVEHPQWVADDAAKRSIDWREGASHGRIWRVRRRDQRGEPSDAVRLDRAGTAELVAELRSTNAWRRDTAQRLLVEGRSADAVGPLAQLALAGPTPLSRAHALWTLAGLDALDLQILERALSDPTPQVRRQAIRLATADLEKSSTIRAAVTAGAGDADRSVRFETAIAIGGLDGDEKDAALVKLAAARAGNHWDSVALQLAIGRSAWRFLRSLVDSQPGLLVQPEPAEQELLHDLGWLVGRRRDPHEVADCLQLLLVEADGPLRSGRLATLAGLAQGMSQSGLSIRQLRAQPPEGLEQSLRILPDMLAKVHSLVLTDKAPRQDRLGAIDVLAHCGTASDPADLLKLLAADQPQELSTAAADAVVRLADAALAEQLFSGWDSYTTATRRALPVAALRSPAATQALVAALEAKAIRPVEIDMALRDLLLRLPDLELRQRANQVLASAVPADRRQVLGDFSGALALAADRRRGAALVTQHCLACHQIQNRGQRVGPDLSGIASHPKEQLLVSLLDPSRQVSPDYLAYTLVTTDGQILTGLVASETASTVTLRRAESKDEAIPREQIELLRASGKSLMPDGFEQKLNPQDVADVLEFLTHPDPALLGASGGLPGATDQKSGR